MCMYSTIQFHYHNIIEATICYLFILLVLLSSVKEARSGANTEGFKSSGKTYEHEKCFSIIYGSDFKTLDLVCQNVDEAEIWTKGVKALKHHTGILKQFDLVCV